MLQLVFCITGPPIFGPVLFDVTPQSPSTISAAWRPPAEIIEIIDYSVCYRDTNNGEEQCTTTEPTTPNGPVEIKFTNLNEDTTYEVVVRARNKTGYGPPSNVMNVKTKPLGQFFFLLFLIVKKLWDIFCRKNPSSATEITRGKKTAVLKSHVKDMFGLREVLIA